MATIDKPIIPPRRAASTKMEKEEESSHERVFSPLSKSTQPPIPQGPNEPALSLDAPPPPPRIPPRKLPDEPTSLSIQPPPSAPFNTEKKFTTPPPSLPPRKITTATQSSSQVIPPGSNSAPSQPSQPIFSNTPYATTPPLTSIAQESRTLPPSLPMRKTSTAPKISAASFPPSLPSMQPSASSDSPPSPEKTLDETHVKSSSESKGLPPSLPLRKALNDSKSPPSSCQSSTYDSMPPPPYTEEDVPPTPPPKSYRPIQSHSLPPPNPDKTSNLPPSKGPSLPPRNTFVATATATSSSPYREPSITCQNSTNKKPPLPSYPRDTSLGQTELAQNRNSKWVTEYLQKHLNERMWKRFRDKFETMKLESDTVVKGKKVEDMLRDTRLHLCTLSYIWEQSDVDKDGDFTWEEFCLCAYLIERELPPTQELI